MKQLSRAQKRVLWMMGQGWQLRQIFKIDNTIHWRLVCGGKSENGSFRINKNTAIILGTDIEAITTDARIHNQCYRIFTLTQKGAELAKSITEADFT